MAPISVSGSECPPSQSPHRMPLPLPPLDIEHLSPLNGLEKCHKLWRRRGGGGSSFGGGSRGFSSPSSSSSSSSSDIGSSPSSEGKTSSGSKSPTPAVHKSAPVPKSPHSPKFPKISNPKPKAGGLLPPFNHNPKPGKIPGYEPHHDQPHSSLTGAPLVGHGNGHGHKGPNCSTTCRNGLLGFFSILGLLFLAMVLYKCCSFGCKARNEERRARRSEEVVAGGIGEADCINEERTTHGQGAMNSRLWLSHLHRIIPETDFNELSQAQNRDVELTPRRGQEGGLTQARPDTNKPLSEIPLRDIDPVAESTLRDVLISTLGTRNAHQPDSPPPEYQPQRSASRGRSSTSYRNGDWTSTGSPSESRSRASLPDYNTVNINYDTPRAGSRNRSFTRISRASDADDGGSRSRSRTRDDAQASCIDALLNVRDNGSTDRDGSRSRTRLTPNPSLHQYHHTSHSQPSSSSSTNISLKTARSRNSRDECTAVHSSEPQQRGRSRSRSRSTDKESNSSSRHSVKTRSPRPNRSQSKGRSGSRSKSSDKGSRASSRHSIEIRSRSRSQSRNICRSPSVVSITW